MQTREKRAECFYIAVRQQHFTVSKENHRYVDVKESSLFNFDGLRNTDETFTYLYIFPSCIQGGPTVKNSQSLEDAKVR